MMKKVLRYVVSPRCVLVLVLVVVVLLYVYRYLVQVHCYAGVYCAGGNMLMDYSRSTTTSTTTAVAVKPQVDREAPACLQCVSSNYTKVNVNVNHRERFTGLQINKELYVPFKFLKKYYEVHGESEKATVNKDGIVEENFLWLHTARNDLDPWNLRQDEYLPVGRYLNFKDSDVANRARVKCICGKFEVPITTQWDANGYYYPTQIAQYGLSHLSKHFSEDVRQKETKVKLKKQSKGATTTKLSINPELRIIKVKVTNRVSPFSVKVIASDQNRYTLAYTADKVMIARNGKTITHGMGKNSHKGEIVRDLNVDLIKGLSFREGRRQGSTAIISIRKIYELIVHNVEHVVSVRFTNVDHVSKFMAAANWFIHFQDRVGGWKTNVTRVVFKGIRREGSWYSAMGQGQAISLLSRVYDYTHNRKYLDTALKATQVFDVPSEGDGVLSMVFDRYPWYEEYPTSPTSLHVLNGFIYSLFGLYDLSKAASKEDGADALRLFRQGMKSLEALLPLFDNGHGTFYDLRHLAVPGHPPMRARWQYHRVHLEQLSSLIDITKSSVLNRTLHRWILYGSGVPTRHN